MGGLALLMSALALSLMTPAPAETGLLKPAEAFAVAFNAGQQRFPEEAFADDAIVMDQFAPFVWSGKNGARTWWSRLLGATPARHKKMLALHEHLVLHRPEFITITGDRAYFNIPCSFTYILKGKAVAQEARWVVTEQRFAQGWKIVAHAWAVSADS